MKKNYFFTLLLCLIVSSISFGQIIVINEVDADNAGTDDKEFIELKTTSPNMSLNGYCVVLFNGSGDVSYNAFDLDGYTSDANGLFVLGSSILSPSPNFTFTAAANEVQNGADAVAVYQDDASNFPDGTSVTTTNLIDAFVYDTNDGDDSGLLTGLGVSIQYNEDENGNKDGHSNQRKADGTYEAKEPTPSVVNYSSDPSMSISSPSNNTVFSPETTTIPIVISVQNFTLSGDAGDGSSDSTGDGYIKVISTETGNPQSEFNLFSVTPDIQAEAGRTYTGDLELVDNDGNSLSPAVTASFSVSVAEYNVVGTISEIRSGTEGDYFHLTNEAILTYQRSSRNQKYVEDASGAILIDDNDGVLTTSYNVADGITGLKGKLSSYGGVLQFVPSVDVGVASSTANAITPQVVSISDLNSSLDNYESEWITIENVTFEDADGVAVFEASNNYNISDGVNTLVFRTNFSEADYIGELIPTGNLNITGIGGEFNGTSQVYGTSTSNMVLDVERNGIDNLSIYPNPLVSNKLNISTSNPSLKEVVIFNVLGKQVFRDSFEGNSKSLNVNLPKGVYVLKIEENNKISTKKLIVE